MEGSSLFKGNPLIKLAVPMMFGIAFAWHGGVEMPQVLSMLAVALVVLLFGLSRSSPKWLFGVGAVAFMFFSGAFVERSQRKAMEPRWGEGKALYEALLLEVPEKRGTNVKVLADVALVDSCAQPGTRVQGKAYLYFQRSVDSDGLAAGDVVSFEAEMQPPKNAGNPAEFDNESYSYIKGVTGLVSLWDGDWTIEGGGEKTLQMCALELRQRVVSVYERLGFEGDALALLSALTVGEKRDFPRELKEKYAAAGASHVLALSGLHLGIVYLLLATLLPLRGRNCIVIVARETVIVAALWGVAFMAGLSPSVVRAAILFTLMSVGRCVDRNSSSLSSLAFAAIAMLLVSPHLLFDISFQLSFSAVLAILLLAPHLQRLFRVDECGAAYGYVANLFILSIAAQIGTLPFIWYHFGVLPLYSLLTNILVVPLAFVCIALAMIMLALFFFPWMQQFLADALQFVIGIMNDGVGLVAGLPGASFALAPIGVWGAVCVALMVLFMTYATVCKKWWMLTLSVSCSMLLCVLNVVIPRDIEPKEGLIIYNNNKNPLLHVVAAGGENWLLSTVPQLDAEYEYVSSPYVKREKLDAPVWVNDNFSCAEFGYCDGLLKYDGLSIRLVADDLWRENLYSVPTDVVVVCRGFLGSISELCEVYPTGCIVLDASLYKHSRKRILRECATLEVDAVDLSTSGAIKVARRGEAFEIIPLRGK